MDKMRRDRRYNRKHNRHIHFHDQEIVHSRNWLSPYRADIFEKNVSLRFRFSARSDQVAALGVWGMSGRW